MTPDDDLGLDDDLQALADRLTCLGMEMAEHLRDVHARFTPPSTADTTEENR